MPWWGVSMDGDLINFTENQLLATIYQGNPLLGF